jgi:hypothetical protein
VSSAPASPPLGCCNPRRADVPRSVDDSRAHRRHDATTTNGECPTVAQPRCALFVVLDGNQSKGRVFGHH